MRIHPAVPACRKRRYGLVLPGAVLFTAGLSLCLPAPSGAQEDLRFQVLETRGRVMVYRDQADETVRLHRGQKVDDGDRVTTPAQGGAVLRLKGRAYLYVAPHTVVRVSRLQSGDRGPWVRLNLVRGRILCQLDRTPSWAFEVSAGKLVCRGHGTLFEASRKKDDFLLVCYEGNVVATSPGTRAQMAKARQVVKFGAGRFRYRRYLRLGEREDLEAWRKKLQSLRHPARSPSQPGR